MTVVAANQTADGNSSSHVSSGDIHALTVTVNSASDDARWYVQVQQESGSGSWKDLNDVRMFDNSSEKALLFVAKDGLNLRTRTELIKGTIDLKIEID